MKTTTQQFNLIFYGMAGLFIVCIGGLLLLQAIGFKQAGDQVEKDFGERIAHLCDPVPDSADDLAQFPLDRLPNEILVLQAGTNRLHNWHGSLPGDWRAVNQDLIALVVCIRNIEAPETPNECELKDGFRFMYGAPDKALTEAVILNAQTGVPIGRLEFERVPEDRYLCNDMGWVRSSDGHATAADFVAAIEPYAVGTVP